MIISRRELVITPRIRGMIQSRLQVNGAAAMQYHGLKLEFRYDLRRVTTTPVKWRARIRGEWHEGFTTTVFDAAQEIETIANRAA